MTSTSISQFADESANPSRIQLARERQGLSKVMLAAKLGVSTRVLHTYETQGCPTKRVSQLAEALGVHPRFFQRPERSALAIDQGFFRARRRATAAQLCAARAAASIGAEVYDWIDERFLLPTTVVPDLDHQDPGEAAATLRAMWGQADDALPNLVQLSEAHGVRVLSLPTQAEAVDAFSFWLDGVPYVFLSTLKTPERSRFDLAHELGHLVMHSRVPVGEAHSPAIEQQADTFASCLLMPRQHVLAHGGREPAVPQIIALRDYYRVSAMAMTRRLRELGRLSEWAYRQNCVVLSQRGFRTSEPGGIARERSRVFSKVLCGGKRRSSVAGMLCQDLGITALELHGLTFGMVTTSISGGNERMTQDRPVVSLIGS